MPLIGHLSGQSTAGSSPAYFFPNNDWLYVLLMRGEVEKK